MSDKPQEIEPRRGPLGALVHALLFALSCLARLLPRPLAYGLASLLGWVLHAAIRWRDPRRAKRGRGVSRNARLALGPAADPAQVQGLVRGFARHLGWLVMDLLRLDGLDLARVDASELDRLRPWIGKGLLVITGHLGSWEHLGAIACRVGFPLVVLARPLPLAGANAWLVARRRRAGMDVRSKFGGLWGVRRSLKAGGVVGMLVDENARDGLFVPWCGVLAATNPSPAQLQRVTGVPVAVATCNRVGPERWKVHVWDILEPRPDEPREEAEARITAAVTAGLERALRAYPEQWLWSLRRWETRPEGEVPGPDGLPPRVGPGLAG